LIPTFFAFAAAAGTPPAIVAKLNAELKKALADPAIADKLTNAGLVVNGGSPEAMTNTVKQEVPHFAALVKSIGIKPE
jgi:tripartite-type tricarboxylate transporter receptor subunit TctC